MKTPRNKKVTIKELALKLGISAATVSRALNPKTQHMIRTSLVDQIRSCAVEMGYIPNISAASLRQQNSQVIGVMIPDILNPVFPPMVKGIQNYLSRHGYVTIFVFSNNDQGEAMDEMRGLLSRGVDGLIIASAFLEDECVNECIVRDVPLVLVNRSIREGRLVNQVLCDDRHGIELLLDHLWDKGHRHVVHLPGPPDILQGHARRLEFETASEKLGFEIDVANEGQESVSPFSLEAGYVLAQNYINAGGRATACLAGNDLMAVGAVKAFREAGWSVPADISVCGFNNMPLADLVDPALTTVAVPYEELGEQAARMMLKELTGKLVSKQRWLLSPHLETRESTADIPSSVRSPGAKGRVV